MTYSGSKSRRFNRRGGEPEIVLLVVVVVVVVVVVLVGVAHDLRTAAPTVFDGVADERTKPRDEEDKPLLLHVLALLLLLVVTTPERTLLAPILVVLSVCKPGVRRPPAAAAAAITRVAQCKSRQQLLPPRGRKGLLPPSRPAPGERDVRCSSPISGQR
jgi:hypothetical protein